MFNNQALCVKSVISQIIKEKFQIELSFYFAAEVLYRCINYGLESNDTRRSLSWKIVRLLNAPEKTAFTFGLIASNIYAEAACKW